ncbi:MAG: iron ABC transporter permease [Fibrobacterota bacterium]|nr:MAG: iron ABC transporter permease [Fibrobacterota bacterium]
MAEGRKSPVRRFAVLGGSLLLAIAIAVLWGSSDLSGFHSLSAIFQGPRSDEMTARIVWQVRLPRVLVVALVGAALSASGGAFQSLFRNPMADPSLLGIASGGSFAAVMVLFHLPSAPVWFLPVAAFLGCLATAILLVVLAGAGGAPSLATTLLTGVVLGSLFTSCTSLSLLLSDEYQLRQLVFWLSGGAEARGWMHVALSLPPIALGMGILWGVSRWLDALSLGEDHAQSLGVPLERARGAVLVGTALAVGGAVGVCGPVGFVGLIIPHLVRPLFGSGNRALLPAAALAGALLLVLADFAARVFLPAGIQLGVLTSLMGVPFFLRLLARERRVA